VVSSRNIILKNVFDNGGGSPWLGWLFMSFWCIVFGGIACIITLKIAPGAAGSGIAEIMGYLNGVNVDKIIGVETLIIKVFGVAIAISG
jgi:H+/Cl- antiporter ClcA